MTAYSARKTSPMPLLESKAPAHETHAPASIAEAIYASYEEDAGDWRRDHLGASQIGKECERALWYDFRWATRPQFPGRILRLLNTGKLEEARLVDDLRRICVDVVNLDPKTGNQWRVEAMDGHFGGSLDAVAVGLIFAPKVWHVVEFKTHNVKSFASLQRDGLCKSKPRHWAQMQVYMYLIGIGHGLYVAVRKDTDDIYTERVALDRVDAERLLAKAERVIKAARPPAKISADPAHRECRYCDHRALCHGDAAAELSCRTCIFVERSVGSWYCRPRKQTLPPDMQREGCASHIYIPDLIPGEIVAAGDDWIEYRMRDGRVWRNGPWSPA